MASLRSLPMDSAGAGYGVSDEEEEFEDTNDDLDKGNNDEFILSDGTSGSETADSPEVAFPMAQQNRIIKSMKQMQESEKARAL
ncbi:hypothetical protein Ccrd_010895 [Cynara cardunculus var. scolymus]|uniref:Uncharacterized protein n=1 Tax=Cynara cardunculus var. scolymus TaxID=59895 RepID=A0A103YKG5_CYNCS|nr:hypothetical protein Ccrd_010895 [Cynara cardunculus var. scolymus]